MIRRHRAPTIGRKSGWLVTETAPGLDAGQRLSSPMDEHGAAGIPGFAGSGHPIAATGAMRMVTLLHEMKRREVVFGLETICGGGGQGICAIVERP